MFETHPHGKTSNVIVCVHLMLAQFFLRPSLCRNLCGNRTVLLFDLFQRLCSQPYLSFDETMRKERDARYCK